ncbi:MAG: thiamine phosphate synthase [Balneolaceae bacterium]
MIDFRYYLVTGRNQCQSGDLEECVRQACRSGVRAVQLREKDLSGAELYRLAKRLRAVTGEFGAGLWINDRLDIALAVQADGIHCPEDGLPPDVVKRHAPGLKIGASVHSPEAARKAEQAGADFLLFGPVFKTRSKPEAEPQGIPELKKITGQSRLPVFAIGGITPKQVGECLEAGAWGVAGISSILGSNKISKTVTEYSIHLETL